VVRLEWERGRLSSSTEELWGRAVPSCLFLSTRPLKLCLWLLLEMLQSHSITASNFSGLPCNVFAGQHSVWWSQLLPCPAGADKADNRIWQNSGGGRVWQNGSGGRIWQSGGGGDWGRW